MLNARTGLSLQFGDTSLTLTKLIETGIAEFTEEMEEVGALAAAEYAVERLLERMASEWRVFEIPLEPHQESDTHVRTSSPPPPFLLLLLLPPSPHRIPSPSCLACLQVLGACDDIYALLDGQIIKTQSLRGSPYIGPFEERISTWSKTLTRIQEIFDEWLICQRNWMYLYPIFMADDIQKQIPAEARRFESVDATWRKTMEQAATIRLVLRVCASGLLLERLKEANRHLGRAMRGLEIYLDRKRQIFPRFYFLSDDELVSVRSTTTTTTSPLTATHPPSLPPLLQVLSSSSPDPLAVQPHLPKFFEGINRLVFLPTSSSSATTTATAAGQRRTSTTATGDQPLAAAQPAPDGSEVSSALQRRPSIPIAPRHVIVGMVSPEGEHVPFSPEVQPDEEKKRGYCELWLQDVESSMRTSLLEQFDRAIHHYFEVARKGDGRRGGLQGRDALLSSVNLFREKEDALRAIDHLAQCSSSASSSNQPTTPSAEADQQGSGSGGGSSSNQRPEYSTVSIQDELLLTCSADNFASWAMEWPAQVALNAAQIFWTSQVESALSIQSGGETFITDGGPHQPHPHHHHTLSDLVTYANGQLRGLVLRIRGELTELSRITIGAILTKFVYQRDVVSQLSANNVHSTSDFQWLSQLRYYWEASPHQPGNPNAIHRKKKHEVSARMMAATLGYDLEYLGASCCRCRGGTSQQMVFGRPSAWCGRSWCRRADGG